MYQPSRGGSASTRAPYCSTKYCLICASIHPAASFSRISARHCAQACVGHTSRGVFSHTGQYICWAIWFTSSSDGVGCWAETLPIHNVEIKAVKKTIQKKRFIQFLRGKLKIILSTLIAGLVDHFLCATHARRYIVGFLIGPGSNKRAKNQQQRAQPEPVDQRVVVNLERGLLCGNAFP